MVKELDAAPDWLTVTTCTYRDTEYLRRIGMHHMGSGSGSRPWTFRDYYGRRKHDPKGGGGIAFGERDSGCFGILQTWGAMTKRVGDQLAEHRVKPTRVDLAVTILHDKAQPPIRELIADYMDIGSHLSAVVPLTADGGTLYVGHRSSDAFGRLYDKGAQLGCDVPPCMLWRYEVEYKRELAKQAADKVWFDRPSAEDARDIIVANVEGFFRGHSIPMPFTSKDASHHSLVRYATRIQDDEKTLKWLSEQVQPALLRLIHNEKYEAVCAALGVSVRDGVPFFEADELAESNQLNIWDYLDKSEVLGYAELAQPRSSGL